MFGVSPDFTKLVTSSNQALAPGAIAGKTNLYLEDLRTGQLSLAAVAPTYLEFQLSFAETVPLRFFGSRDWSRFYTTSPYSLTSSSYEEINNGIYELKGGTPTLLTLHSSNGEAVGGPGQVGMSPDERYFTYARLGEAGQSGGGAFLSNGSEVTPISVSERPGDPITPQGASAFRWVGDGSAVVFQDDDPSAMPLTADAPEGVGNIYRYLISAPAGHHLQYVGKGELFATAADTVLYHRGGGTQLFAWRKGQTHVLSESLLGSEEGGQTLISPSGRYVEVATQVRLTEDAPTAGTQIYLFDLDAGGVRCASCNGLADAGRADAGFADSPAAPTDEGEVFFDTSTGLVSGDANGTSDVYAYKAGHVQLISRATPETYALLAGASASGHDVFIDTNDRLVSQDKDSAGDIYDARIGGGIAAQNPNPRGACSGSACRGVTSTPAPPALLGSESLESTGNLSPAASKPPGKSLTRAQLLSRALKACKAKRPKRKRMRCERQARKRHGPALSGKSKAKRTIKKSTNGKGSK